VEPTGHFAVCGIEGHYFCDNKGPLDRCELCGAYLCAGDAHGEGLCLPVAEGEEASEGEEAPEAAEAVLSSDTTLYKFVGELSDGTLVNLRDPGVRSAVYTDADSIYVTAEASDENAVLTGDMGLLYLEEGENRFGLRCTAPDGSDSYFRFIIYREKVEYTPISGIFVPNN